MNKVAPFDEETLKEVAAQLYDIDAIQFGEFKLTSGKISPYYVDLRIVPSYPKLFDVLTEICAELIDREIEDVDRLAGIPTSGLPFASLVSYKLELPLAYVRTREKSHGQKKAVEGLLDGGNVALIDDVTTTGGSIKNAAENLSVEGGTVNHAVVVLDREEGAVEALEAIGIHLHSCFRISELVGYLRAESNLSEEKYSLVMDYLE